MAIYTAMGQNEMKWKIQFLGCTSLVSSQGLNIHLGLAAIAPGNTDAELSSVPESSIGQHEALCGACLPALLNVASVQGTHMTQRSPVLRAQLPSSPLRSDIPLCRAQPCTVVANAPPPPLEIGSQIARVSLEQRITLDFSSSCRCVTPHPN